LTASPHGVTFCGMSTLRRALAIALLLPCAALAQGRQLTWPKVSVTAHLDSAGALTVRETQTILFSGDWNGAERSFDLRNGQTLDVTHIGRVDPTTGASKQLTPNDDLTNVDDFAWANGGSTLRWRARLPSDPPFDNTIITYDIEAVYGRILVPQPDGSFLLDHNFAMVDREGIIDRFELTLTLDPAWAAPAGFTGRYEPGAIEPYTGYLVTIPLTYRGASRPASIRYGASDETRKALLFVLGAALVVLFLRLVTREARLGRFAPIPDRSEITAEWLEQHVLSMLPEVAGAMWDDHTAGAEVAAVLARMVHEKKLTSRVETTKVLIFTKTELHLTLEEDRGRLTPHERALIDGLFNPGHRHTSTSMVRERYRSSGFDPASTIRARLETIIGQAMPGGNKPSWKPTALVILAALVVIGYGFSRDVADIAIALATVGISIPVYLIAGGFAIGVQRSLGRLFLALFFLCIPLAIGLYAFAQQLLFQPVDALGPITLIGLTLWVCGQLMSVFNVAASRHSAERVAARKRLFAARRLFREELRNERPALKDAWFPYVIAFGLGGAADKWFRAFGGASHAGGAVMTGASSGSFGGRDSGGSGWTGFGGGGGFSGGGSSASFAAAVGGMAASVPSPSSSSSGGGSSSGGRSSGGGGGGGW